jgi:hypothetical protein
MPEAIPAFDDPNAITFADDESEPNEPAICDTRHGCNRSLARGYLYLAWREHPNHIRTTRHAA